MLALSNLRRTKLKGWYEYYRETCPICHKRGGCMINEKGDTVVCIRNESSIEFSKNFQSWVHRLKEKRKTKPSDETIGDFIEGNKKATPDTLHKTYKGFIEATTLTDSHYNHLVKRSMTDDEISIREFRSFPDKPWYTVKAVKEITGKEDFDGVPGFYKSKFGWNIAGRQGIMIPYRNEYNQIIGYQTRVDNPLNDVTVKPGSINGLQAVVKEQPNLVQILIEGEIIEEISLELGKTHMVYRDGVGSVTLVKGQRYFWTSSANKLNGTGAGDPLPIHVAVPTDKLKTWEPGNLLKSSSVWITEGALKADIAVQHIPKIYDVEELDEIGTTFLATAGVNTWRYLMPILKNMGVKHVNIAFDMDAMEKPKVAYQLQQLAKELKKNNYTANLAMWNPENDQKGIDDILARKRIPKFKRLF